MNSGVPSTEYRVEESGKHSVLGTRYSNFSILHVASGREWRGGQRQVLYLTQALAKTGLRQQVATGGGTRLAQELRNIGVPVVPLDWGPAFDLRALAGVMKAASSAGTILHAHDSHALTLAAGAAWRHRLGLVATRRVDFPIKTPWLWRRADRVVAISQAVQDVALKSGLSPKRTVVVHSGIPLEPTFAEPANLRQQLGLPADSVLAVTVGDLVAHKDHRTLIEAAGLLRRSHPSLHWVLAGDGPLRSALAAQVNRLELGQQFHLLGRVPDGRAVIAAGDLMVVSSKEEGLNTSVLDAMLLQTPVVSTDAGGLPEALEGGAGLICARGDPVALARAVATLLAESSLRQRLVSTARVRVRRFGSDRMAEGMLSVYHSVARAT